MILLFFDISGGELLVILAAVFVVFGPKKVPEIARQIGKGMNELKRATSDITREFQEGINQAQDEVNKVKNTIEVSNQRMNNEFMSGPVNFDEDNSVLPDNQPTVKSTENQPITEQDRIPDRSVPRNDSHQ